MEIDSKNILFIIIGLVFLAIIGVVIYLIAKSKSTPTPPSNQICSVSNQSGTCPDTYNCIKGICTTTVPQSSSCSASNPTGICGSLGWICSGGTCTDPSTCSASNPKGSCTQYGTVCTNGTCIIPQSTDCSPTNLKGNCPTGLSCLTGRCLPPIVPYCTGNSDNCNDPTSCICPTITPYCNSGKCTTPPVPYCTGNNDNCNDSTSCICPTNTPSCISSGKCSISYCTGKNSDNCNDPTSCICPSNTPVCDNGKCTHATLPYCSTDPKLICNVTCTCSTGNCSTTGKCIPNCGSSDDCSTGSCMCPNAPGDPLRYCDSTRHCSIQGDKCTEFQSCLGGNCTCATGFTCNNDGYCVQDNIIIYSEKSYVELPTDVYVRGKGGYHANSVVGCWTLDDPGLTSLKGGA